MKLQGFFKVNQGHKSVMVQNTLCFPLEYTAQCHFKANQGQKHGVYNILYNTTTEIEAHGWISSIILSTETVYKEIKNFKHQRNISQF